MRKLLLFLLALSLILPLVSCASSLDAGTAPTAETAEETKTKEQNTEEKEVKIPEGFSTGFARQDVSPYGTAPTPPKR